MNAVVGAMTSLVVNGNDPWIANSVDDVFLALSRDTEHNIFHCALVEARRLTMSGDDERALDSLVSRMIESSEEATY